jgi:hypothetical protein
VPDRCATRGVRGPGFVGWALSADRAQRVGGRCRGGNRLPETPRRETGLKLPRSKAVTPSDGLPARTAAARTPESLANDDAVQRPKRSTGGSPRS